MKRLINGFKLTRYTIFITEINRLKWLDIYEMSNQYYLIFVFISLEINITKYTFCGSN